MTNRIIPLVPGLSLAVEEPVQETGLDRTPSVLQLAPGQYRGQLSLTLTGEGPEHLQVMVFLTFTASFEDDAGENTLPGDPPASEK